MALAVNSTHKTISPMGLLRRLLEVGCGLVLLACRPDISVIVCGICVSSRLQEQLGHVLTVCYVNESFFVTILFYIYIISNFFKSIQSFHKK